MAENDLLAKKEAQEKISPAGFTPLGQDDAKPAARTSPGRYLLIAGVLLIALVLTFLFTARSLHITVVSETTAEIDISGLVLPFGERFLLLPGRYKVSAQAEGYRDLSTLVTVDDRASQSVALTLQALPGRLTVYSHPEGASVYLDGEATGTTPLDDIAVDSGEHTLRLEHSRFLPLEQRVTVTGRAIRQQLDLNMEPAWARVKVVSTPPGATVLLDGEPLGATPGTFEVVEGRRQLQLELEGFANLLHEITVVAGEDQDLGLLELNPAAGNLRLDSKPAGASVILDGEFSGHTPLSLALTPGTEHTLDVFKPGYQRHSETISLEAGGSDSKTIILQALLGDVHVEISPDSAQLLVDGRPRGKGSQTLSLTAVEHVIEVRLEGHATQRRRVTPRPGLPQQLSMNLLTSKAARLASIPPQVTTALGQTLLLFNPADSGLAEFTLGASRRESGRRANEVQRPVALKRMFYLQTTEVTNAHFRQYQAGHDSGHTGGTTLNGGQQPVVDVTWQQAASFCNWLSRREGLTPFYRENQGIITGFNPSSTGYRLPTEAEWAWAARSDGAELQKFPWLGKFPPTVAVENYAGESSAYITGRVLNGYKDGHVVTARVGSYGPNQNGLFDMGGNVAEWVHDAYTIPAPDSPRQTDPLGAQQGDNHVIRGASWTRSRLTQLRLAHRDYGQSGRDDVGFRIARYAE